MASIFNLLKTIVRDSRPILDRQSTDSRSTADRHIDVLADISAEATYSTHDPNCLLECCNSCVNRLRIKIEIHPWSIYQT